MGSMETMWETWSSTPTHRYCPSHFLLSWYQIRPSRESGLLPKSSSNKAPPPNSIRDAMWGVMRQPSTPSQTAISGCTIESLDPHPYPAATKHLSTTSVNGSQVRNLDFQHYVTLRGDIPLSSLEWCHRMPAILKI